MSHYMRYAISYGRFTKRPYMLDAHGASLLARTSAAIFTIAFVFLSLLRFSSVPSEHLSRRRVQAYTRSYPLRQEVFSKNAFYRPPDARVNANESR